MFPCSGVVSGKRKGAKWKGEAQSEYELLMKYFGVVTVCNFHFAIAIHQISSDHTVALNVITYVGCALSLVGEVLTVIAYCALM